ncbi:MAG: hypothetical protein AAFZ18_13660 [Myxococcota bacterium]
MMTEPEPRKTPLALATHEGENKKASTSSSRLSTGLGRVGAFVLRQLVRLFGRTVRSGEAVWLEGPSGASARMSESIYDELAEKKGLEVRRDARSGLIPSTRLMAGPSFDPRKLDPRIRHFYEYTSQYELDLRGETHPMSRPLLWLLVNTVGRSMNQLSLPIRGEGRQRKVVSEIVELVDDRGRSRLTGWSRKDADAEDASYIGFYTLASAPGHDSPCVKAMFPVPRGLITVLLRPSLRDGRLYLESEGGGFGNPGWYLSLRRPDGVAKVVQLGWLQTSFEVQADRPGHLYCHQLVSVRGVAVLKFRYRMVRRVEATPLTRAA